MKIYTTLILLLISVVGLCSCTYCNRYFSLPDDNFAEEFVEDVIEMETGLEIDFTP